MPDKALRTLPNDGNGSPERVAWEMVLFFKGIFPTSGDAKDRMADHLDFYAECLQAAKGERNFTPGAPFRT